jgi:hypothetical protein
MHECIALPAELAGEDRANRWEGSALRRTIMVDRWKIVTEKRREMKESGHKTIGEIAEEHGVDRNTVAIKAGPLSLPFPETSALSMSNCRAASGLMRNPFVSKGTEGAPLPFFRTAGVSSTGGLSIFT